MVEQSELLAKIERFIKRHRVDPTNFGLSALNDRNFVFQLRAGGRRLRLKTIKRVLAHMTAANRAAAPPKAA